MKELTQIDQTDHTIAINVENIAGSELSSGTVTLIGPYHTKYEFNGIIKSGILSVNVPNVPSGKYILLSQVYEDSESNLITFLAPQYVTIKE